MAPRNEFGGPKSQPAAHSRARHPSGRARDARRRHRQRPTMDLLRSARRSPARPEPRARVCRPVGPRPPRIIPDRAGRARDRAHATRPAGSPAPALQRQRPDVSAPAPAFRCPAPRPQRSDAGATRAGAAAPVFSDASRRPSALWSALQRWRPARCPGPGVPGRAPVPAPKRECLQQMAAFP